MMIPPSYSDSLKIQPLKATNNPHSAQSLMFGTTDTQGV